MQPRISVPPNGRVTLNTNDNWVRLRDVADGLYINSDVIELTHGPLYYFSADDRANLNPRDRLKFTFTDESKAKFAIQQGSTQQGTSTQQNRLQDGNIGQHWAGSKRKTRRGE
jgi:hypothetical protein